MLGDTAALAPLVTKGCFVAATAVGNRAEVVTKILQRRRTGAWVEWAKVAWKWPVLIPKIVRYHY